MNERNKASQGSVYHKIEGKRSQQMYGKTLQTKIMAVIYNQFDLQQTPRSITGEEIVNN